MIPWLVPQINSRYLIEEGMDKRLEHNITAGGVVSDLRCEHLFVVSEQMEQMIVNSKIKRKTIQYTILMI